MKLLFDSCVARSALADLREAGHDVVAVSELWENDPGDEAVLDRANRDGRILITIDKDFGEMVIVRDLAHAGIVRLVGFRAASQASAILSVLDVYANELLAGALLTVEPWRVRIRSSH